MANTNGPFGFLWAGTDEAGAVKMTRRQTTANTSLKTGDPLFMSGGYLRLAAAADAAIWGVAAEDVTGASGVKKSIAVLPCKQGSRWYVQHRSTLNLTAGYLGAKGGINGTTSGKIGMYYNVNTSTLQIIGLKRTPGNAWGSYAQLLVKVIRSQYDGSIR